MKLKTGNYKVWVLLSATNWTHITSVPPFPFPVKRCNTHLQQCGEEPLWGAVISVVLCLHVAVVLSLDADGKSLPARQRLET